MEYNVEVRPLEGIVLDGQHIRLGAIREELGQIVGLPGAAQENAQYYFRNELRIDFDKRGRVEFIELLGGPDGALQPVIDGVAVFLAKPELVTALLREKNGGEPLDNEKGYSYTFLNLSVGLYRENVPENVDEMIEQAKADGHPLSEEDIEHEKRRTHWATIGVGAAGYYR